MLQRLSKLVGNRQHRGSDIDHVLRLQTRELLRDSVGDPNAEFRRGQWEAIQHIVVDRGNLLVVQRTGWGKSNVYFIATRLLRDCGSGPTLLVSPLISLMNNQVLAARRIGIRAETIHSGVIEERDLIAQAFLQNEIDVLLISPERLANSEFRTTVLQEAANTIGIGLLVVDEAHCISDWGHDFRPDYRRLVQVVKLLPRNAPALATTATANDRVVEDTISQLGSDISLIRGSLARESLKLQTISLTSQAVRLAWLAEYVPLMPGSGIIYTLTVRDADLVARWLRSEGLAVEPYHAQLETEDRKILEHRLLDNDVKALVATVALGMGFDKPDLGFVVHFQRPGSVVHYYQQIGRAGRAVDNAYAILLSGDEDNEIIDYFIQSAFPAEFETNEVLNALDRAEDGLTISQIEQVTNVSRSKIQHVLKLLEVESPAPVQKIGTKWFANPVPWELDREKIDRLTRLRQAEQERMNEFLTTKQCLMQFLREELDDPYAEVCGKCANCLGRELIPSTFSQSTASRAHRFLQRSHLVIAPRKVWPGGITAHAWGGRINDDQRLEPGRALCKWGDAGWGPKVREGKRRADSFDQQLIEALATMICDEWNPDPFPTWVAFVPSIRHPELVRDLANRLANHLGLLCIDAFAKTRETAPQKQMENSYQQVSNIASAFRVRQQPGMNGPVFLVDDIVDSRWTFTVLGAMLRMAGGGKVYPVALADSS